MAEAGFPGVDLEIWHGLVAPAGTPPAIVRKLNAAFVAAARAPEIARMVAPQAADILTTTPEEFAKTLAADVDRLGNVIREAGIKGQ
jgi:tripartite-type tricarboxylate transporter receptor subunit TctC